jgi:hypothetical protein
MTHESDPEVWLRGPVPGIHTLLQPVAHSLLQAKEELEDRIPSLSEEQIWNSMNDATPIGIQLRHLAGSLDRLCTYAQGRQLTPQQVAALKRERRLDQPVPSRDELLTAALRSIESALNLLRNCDPSTLTEQREVGRARLPSTVLGLLYHAAEHTQRHLGQIAMTKRMLKDMDVHWEKLTTCDSGVEADIIRSMMEEAGMPVLIQSPTAGVFGYGFGASTPQGAVVSVPSDRLEEARELLATRPPENDAAEKDEGDR